MLPHITVLLSRPEHIRPALAAARELSDEGAIPKVVFLCPGCSSRRACRAEGAPGAAGLPCFTDRRGDCLPPGFRCAGAGGIARLIRDSDLVIPLV